MAFEDIDTGLQLYLRQIGEYPLLTIEDEVKLARRIKRGDKEAHYKGMQYLLGHGLPNLHFHTTTTYSMLRASGVEVGKSDYLGKI